MNSVLNVVLFLIIFDIQFQKSYFDYHKLNMSFDLVQELEIRQCILIESLKNHGLVLFFKEFSSKNIPIVYLNYQLLVKYMNDTKSISSKIGLIFKEKNLDIEEISRVLQKVSILQFVRKFLTGEKIS